MEFDWSTFILEMLNFLVLLWLLQRLLYRPVLGVIAKRRAAIDARLAEAQRIQQEADRLRAEYDGRLKAWETEQQSAREKLQQGLQEERTRLLAALHAELDHERQKRHVIEDQRLAEHMEQAHTVAVTQSLQFLSKMMSRLADASLDEKLSGMAAEDLRLLSDSRRAALRTALRTAHAPDATIHITSAYPLSEPVQAKVMEALTEILERPPRCTWRQDPRLLAGIRVSIGSTVLHANLEDELQFFSERAPYDASGLPS